MVKIKKKIACIHKICIFIHINPYINTHAKQVVPIECRLFEVNRQLHCQQYGRASRVNMLHAYVAACNQKEFSDLKMSKKMFSNIYCDW